MPLTRAMLLAMSAIMVTACGREGSPAPAASTSSSAVTVASTPPSAAIDAGPKVAPRIVRLPIGVARASAEIEQVGSERLADHAFDGDPTSGWCAIKLGKDAWVEAELASPQRVRRVVLRSGLGDRLGDPGKLSSLHGRVDDVRVVFDGGGAEPARELAVHLDAATPTTTLEIAGDAPVHVIRVQLVNATKGKKGDDVCLAEVALFGDEPTREAPSGVVPKLRGAALDAALAALPTSPRSASAELLGAFGWPASVQKLALLTRTWRPGREHAELDGDAGEESIARVTLVQKMGTYLLEHDAIAILDDEAHGEVVLGRRLVGGQLCIGPNGLRTDVDLADSSGGAALVLFPEVVTLASHVAHTQKMHDVVIRSTHIDACDAGYPAGRDAMTLVTIERGAVETLATYLAPWSDVPVNGYTKLTPAIVLECDGAAPCSLRGLGSTSPSYYRFEEELFSYR